MIFILLILSLLFVTIGYIVTEKNAKYLLSGYNTMSEENRKAFDLSSYIPAFRRFHLFLGVSFLLIGSAFTFLISETAAGIFMAVYPIVAYISFLGIGKKYYRGNKGKGSNIGIGILIAALIFILALMALGTRENEMRISTEKITIDGMYGEEIAVSGILSVCLVDSLPLITLRTNGFGLGNIRKGYFMTSNGIDVKLIMNSGNNPCILITKNSGEEIFYSAREIPNKTIFAEIQKKIPGISCSEMVENNK
jgi:hypothetical protein